ncbi:hypothetical protein B0H13DRAFT_2325753 [Mycena leptocephala]|nr:hypothetical protein B0H13DRAFT_2325753 [Mycena leptocephala]
MLVLLTLPRLLISSRRCVLFLCCPCWSRSLCFAFSSIAGEVRAFPLLPMLILLTLPCLLISSKECVLSLHRLCLSHSLCIAFASLVDRAHFSSIACAHLAHFASPSRL